MKIFADIFNGLDKDMSGEVDYDEFEKLISSRDRSLARFSIDFFTKLDRDKSRTITFREFLKLVYPGWCCPQSLQISSLGTNLMDFVVASV